MAHARYARDGEFYAFWIRDAEVAAPAEECTAIWHRDHRAIAPRFTESEVRAMLAADDFESVPGFEERHADALRGWLEAFLMDVANERKEGKNA